MTVASPKPKPLASLTAFEQKQLHRAVAQARKDYDRANHMLRTPFASPGYHTTYKGETVHETRQSLKFAVALLDTGRPEDLSDAIDILNQVISLQDQDSNSETYGIWPWFLEESIQEMAPPDWNWADFCGTQLVEARLTHADRLPTEVLARIDESIRHAANSIQKRNVPINYTNIVVMGSFVVLMAGEILQDNKFTRYATERLKEFHSFTIKQGTFAEYNSPPYTNVTLNELRRLQRYTQSPELKERIDTLYTLAWQEIAEFYHPQTGQWSGPHSRCYETLLTPQIEGNIHRALGMENPDEVPSLEQHRLSHRCPDSLRHYFTQNSQSLQEPRTLTKIFSQDPPRIVGTTYLEPAFSLGSVNYSDLFNQRRSLLAYWGDTKQVRSLRMRFLHDDYDFTAMQFYSAQNLGNILAGIGFATDGGDRHPYFDRLTDGQFEASDLRLRFEAEGVRIDHTKASQVNCEEGYGIFELDGLYLSLQMIEAYFGKHRGQMEITQTSDRYIIDIVFYSGPRKTFSFPEHGHKQQVAIAFNASLSSTPDTSAPTTASVCYDSSGWTQYTWNALEIEVKTTPASLEYMKRSVE
ncbi:hypothetical protein SH580_03540 [Coraliomargarita algicola]|uniref:Uncharacterized protein n=1 Tax=Coraliomargarita algicola TaxID=3092156 RepID=A0ABZ0RNT1_9BACT|nr:hypothetical protein [Coraliomargarita sp. J2-16]WPJ96778.1 hypothetical protein SH580_03540 [Coraliomargarita sp. J2-16]